MNFFGEGDFDFLKRVDAEPDLLTIIISRLDLGEVWNAYLEQSVYLKQNVITVHAF